MSRAHSYQMVVSKTVAGVDLRVTLGRVTQEQSLAKIAELKGVFGLDLTAADSHRLVEENPS